MGCTPSKRAASTRSSDSGKDVEDKTIRRTNVKDSRLVQNDDLPDTIPMDSYTIIKKGA